MGAAGVEFPRMVKLRCSVKNYDWGIVGNESAVARLYANNSGEAPNEGPFAEFWMGTHESGPSYVVLNGGSGLVKRSNLVSLKDWIEKNPSVLGEKVLNKWGCTLPFLFKVLSVAKGLSIQAHPDKDWAKVLHKQQPDVYKDDNHKPEMALAITEFEALCGFIGLEELKYVVQSIPEIIEMVGTACANKVLDLSEADGEKKLREVLKSLFTELMTKSEAVISEVVSELTSRLNLKREVRDLTDKEELVLRLQEQYPGDVGVIVVFLFNYVKLRPGEALYLGANEPHAYLFGECMECMATSDNVVRAGLTPKYRDVQTLCSMLTYKQGLPEILPGVRLNEYTVKYVPPFDEFEVDSCVLPEERCTVFPEICGPSIFVIMRGEGMITMGSSYGSEMVKEGDVIFIPAYTQITVETTSGMNLYRAGVNSRFLE